MDRPSRVLQSNLYESDSRSAPSCHSACGIVGFVFGKARDAARCSELALALLLFVVLLTAPDLPLVDLPQHALQLANWLRIDAGDPRARAELMLNFRTPYLLAYPVLRVLCELTSVLTALKLVFWASIVLQAVTLRRLCERLGHDPRLGNFGFPLGVGYAFCFGFVAFCAALPLVYLAFELAFTHREAPSRRSGAWLALVLALLLIAHGVALGFWVLVCAPVLATGGGKLWQRVWPIAAPPLLAAVWLMPGRSSTRLGGDLWEPSLVRFVELPAQLVGIGAVDASSTVVGSLLLACVAAHLGAPRRWVLVLPVLTCLIGYAAFPVLFRGAGPLHPRFSSFLVPALLMACAPRRVREPKLRLLLGAAPPLLAFAVLVVFWSRLPAFQEETRGFHEIAAELPPGVSLRPIVFDRASLAFPGTPAHLHVPAYYSLEKGGDPGYSFAMYVISVVRFRPGVRVKMGGGAEWAPEWFDAEREAADYDYFLVKSATDRSAQLFPGPRPTATLERHAGDWWAYRRVRELRTHE
ncbi:MAG: hypothetical protein K0R38_6387 [Polyangiaceae bacterium]|nr:hypothetical protein [Polyangiaceae bacterium]